MLFSECKASVDCKCFLGMFPPEAACCDIEDPIVTLEASIWKFSPQSKVRESHSVESTQTLTYRNNSSEIQGLIASRTNYENTRMAFDQQFLKKWKSIPTAGDDSEKASAGFDCNICLDFARDPVVTLCGHLYCWPCIYKWLNFQSASLASDELPQCPVCKAEVSEKTLIPLYGGGKSRSEIEQGDKIIPPRPPARGIQGFTYLSNLNQQLTSPTPYQNPNDLPNHYASYEEDSSSILFNSAATGVSPMIGKFGEMVYARVFGNSQSLYTYPNSYHLVGSSTSRLRRQELEADKSLFRISIFLFCCFLLCFLLF
ncbi:E3 ubiquitin-protein ligase RMA1 [Abeliophyllum distichum]|uniref:E3 ubiquitin-protein ligase RMA n=1 Tax=Abeliophyllum distichum TaxID=126358 RepID=A0ABD1UGM5_9LAMI